jgi:hypothetical protein
MARFNSSKLRSAISRYNSAVNRYNSDVRQYNSRLRRAVADYNQRVTRFNSQLRELQRQLRRLQARPPTRVYAELHSELRAVASYNERALLVREDEWIVLEFDEQETLQVAARGQSVELVLVDDEGDEIGSL